MTLWHGVPQCLNPALVTRSSQAITKTKQITAIITVNY